jgi:hypothetical protein
MVRFLEAIRGASGGFADGVGLEVFSEIFTGWVLGKLGAAEPRGVWAFGRGTFLAVSLAENRNE